MGRGGEGLLTFFPSKGLKKGGGELIKQGGLNRGFKVLQKDWKDTEQYTHNLTQRRTDGSFRNTKEQTQIAVNAGMSAPFKFAPPWGKKEY